MKYKIEILDFSNSFTFKPTLSEVLNLINGECKNLKFSIYDLWGMGYNLNKYNSAEEIENTIKNSPSGLKLNWNELKSFSNDFEQIIDFIAVGCNLSDEIPKFKNITDLYQKCELVIDINDGTTFTLITTNKSLKDKIIKTYKHNIETLKSDV